MIPNRDNLIVVGSEDVEGLSGMLKMAAEALKEPRPISGIALRLDGDEWTPWLPDVSHPLYKDFQRLQLQTLGQDYAEQKDLLDKLHVKNGEDVFVATFSVIQSPDGRFFSYATWTDTTNTLLPKTDVLVLGRIGGDPAMVEWQKVVDVVGDLMEPWTFIRLGIESGSFPPTSNWRRWGTCSNEAISSQYPDSGR